MQAMQDDKELGSASQYRGFLITKVSLGAEVTHVSLRVMSFALRASQGVFSDAH